jgi:hypothetical protein
MNSLEKQILDFFKEISPQTLYGLGFEDLKDRIFIPSSENLQRASERAKELIEGCDDSERGEIAKKLLLSIDAVNSFEEPHRDVGLVSEVFATHLIKEGIEPVTYKKIAEQLITAINASLEKFEGRNFSAAIRVLAQYQVIGAYEVLDIIEYGTKDKEFLEKIQELRGRILAFSKRFAVEGFTDGEFDEVMQIFRKQGADLERGAFYPRALREGFDYPESPEELEEKALTWIDEDLPKLKEATARLARKFHCRNTVEAVEAKLRSTPNFKPREALATVLQIRPVVQALVGESIVGINPRYDATVVETPPYLTPIIPSGAAQEFDAFTSTPSRRFYLTTDPKKAPVTSFSDLLNLLVHEEYGHCVHASNTWARYAAEPTLVEMLPSLHGGTTSEGLAFQRELEFLECIQKLPGKIADDSLSPAEADFVSLTKRYGGFGQVLREMEFSTYKQRIIRFLRVLGDARINSGKQDLLRFLEWAEANTGISRRTVYFQIFPAHESIFPGYATCYAVVGQQIREIQKPISNDSQKLVKFNAYASSMGFPARSIYEKRLRKYATRLRASSPAEKDEIAIPPIDPAPIAPKGKLSRKLSTPSVSMSRKGALISRGESNKPASRLGTSDHGTRIIRSPEKSKSTTEKRGLSQPKRPLLRKLRKTDSKEEG